MLLLGVTFTIWSPPIFISCFPLLHSELQPLASSNQTHSVFVVFLNFHQAVDSCYSQPNVHLRKLSLLPQAFPSSSLTAVCTFPSGNYQNGNLFIYSGRIFLLTSPSQVPISSTGPETELPLFNAASQGQAWIKASTLEHLSLSGRKMAAGPRAS